MNEIDVVERALMREIETYEYLVDKRRSDYTDLAQEYQSCADNFNTCLRLWRKYKQKEIIEFP